MKKYSFIIGECLKEEQKYQFRCKDRSYLISSFENDGTEKVFYRTGNMQEAYARWREIKGIKGRNNHSSQKAQHDKQ